MNMSHSEADAVRVAYKWRPIEDLPADVERLASPELRSLAAVWDEQRELLRESEALREFNTRLQRQWAIETGIIEGVYTLDRGVTQLLIEQGIDASLISAADTNSDPQLVAEIIRDHQQGVESLFDFVKGRRQLSAGYIKELHALMTRHQEKTLAVNTLGRQIEVTMLRGEYKQLPNNPMRPDGSIHEYCPPEHVPSEMDQLIELHLQHVQIGVQPEVEAAWLHHRFTQIHPFQDGNGRVARALSSLVFIRAGWFPLLITRDERQRYIAALETADSGDLQPLVDLFAASERKAFVSALGVTGNMLRRERVDLVIESARELLQRRQEELWKEWEKAKETAQSLQEVAAARLSEVAEKLNHDLHPFFTRFQASVDAERLGGDRDYYFRRQIIESAKQLDYYANPNLYRSWVRLILRSDTQAEVLLSFHGIGHEYRGVIVASMSFFRRAETETGEREVTDVTTVSDEVLQINYREDEHVARERFNRWLEDGLARALEAWRSGL